MAHTRRDPTCLTATALRTTSTTTRRPARSDECGEEIYQPVNGKTFMPISVCQGEVCRLNKSDGKVVMQTRGSKFVKYQELRVQELPEQVPVGHIPRSMTVIARGEATRECIPGDICDVTGIFLPTPYTGFQAMRAGLTADTYLEAHHVRLGRRRRLLRLRAGMANAWWGAW